MQCYSMFWRLGKPIKDLPIQDLRRQMAEPSGARRRDQRGGLAVGIRSVSVGVKISILGAESHPVSSRQAEWT